MGGQWIPNSFVMVNLWDQLAEFVDPDGFFNVVAITRAGTDVLTLHDREGNRQSKANDKLIDVFLALRNAGEDSAIVANRGFHECWMTSWAEAEGYLKHQNDEQDEGYAIAPGGN